MDENEKRRERDARREREGRREGRGDGRAAAARNQPNGSGSGAAPWLVVIALVAFIGGMLLSPWFEQQVRPRLPFLPQEANLSTVFARLDRQEASISRLEGRVARLEQTGVGSAPPQIADQSGSAPPRAQPALNDAMPAEGASASADRFGRLETRVDALDRQQTQTLSRVDNLSAEVAGLTVRVEDARGETNTRVRQAERLARDARSVLLIGRARSALEAAEPLGGLEPSLRAALGPQADDDLDQLSAGMRTLSSPADLRRRFEALKPSLLAEAGAESAADRNWWQNFVAGLSDIFTIRRSGTVDDGDTNEQIVDRISAELSQGDIAGAVAEYMRLPEGVRARGTRWLRDAVNYDRTEGAIERLESRLVGEETPAPPSSSDDSEG